MNLLIIFLIESSLEILWLDLLLLLIISFNEILTSLSFCINFSFSISITASLLTIFSLLNSSDKLHLVSSKQFLFNSFSAELPTFIVVINPKLSIDFWFSLNLK